MGSLCLWEVGLAFVVSGASISEWPSQHDRRATGRLLVPGIIAGASVPPSGAALSAGTSWVGRCSDASSRIAATCAGPAQRRSSPCVPFVCAASAPEARLRAVALRAPARRGLASALGLVWLSPSSPCAPSASRGFWARVLSRPCALCRRGYLFFFRLCGRVVCTAQVCMPPVYQLPGPPFAPPNLPGSAQCLDPPSVLQGMRAAGGVCMPHRPRFREPIGCLGP